MQILKEYSVSRLNSSNRLLGNCYKVITENSTFYYEFTKENNVAYLKYDNPDYIEAVIEEYRKSNEYINIIKSKTIVFMLNLILYSHSNYL